jgi:pyruvate/2-oxoacid:ferredoxin oxidoreductase alpha subunit
MATINYNNSINNPNGNTDTTVRIFDKFYAYEENVPMQEYEVVYSYFQSVFANDYQAKNFTIAVFRIAAASDTPAMTLLEEFKGSTMPQLTLNLAYYLNNIRSPSTLLGLNAAVAPNFYVARNCQA